MLQIKTVEPGTFSLLKELMAMPELKEFSLVGGTALFLLYGHRMSIDLDLFCTEPFEYSIVVDALKTKFTDQFIMEARPERFGIFCFIKDVKVDIVYHPHPLIKEIIDYDGIRMFSKEDITAMKVQAILGRGKKKGFCDIFELLQHYSLSQFIQFHKEKYSTQNLLISVPQAIIFFADAEDSEEPVSLKNQTWQFVKQTIKNKVSSF